MKIALDTNRYVDACNGVAEVNERLREVEQIRLPFVVLAELRTGFLLGTKAVENERLLIRFLSTPRVSVLYPDEATTHHYARLVVQLRRQGTPIPINDIWIAALVLQHDLILFARDQHFDSVPQIPRL